MVHFVEREGIEGRIFLVTGGAGFVGSAICLELVTRGASEVRSLDVSKASRNLPALKANGVKCITGDVRRKEAVENAIKGAHCVFHVASFGSLGKQTLQAGRIDQTNLDGTCNVIDACVKHGVERLVYTSTNNVIFGGQPIINGNEAMSYFSIEHHCDPYGRSKALAEQLVLRSNNRPSKKASRKLYTCAIRSPIVYGPGETLHLSRVLSTAKLGLFFSRIGESNARTDFIYVDNLVNAHLLASMALLDDVPGTGGVPTAAGKAYFVSDDAPTNYFEFVRPLVEGLNYKFPQRELSVSAALRFSWFFWGLYGLLYPWLERSWIPDPLLLPSEVHKVGITHYFSSLRARQELGYVPLIDQKEGLERTLAYLKEKKHRELETPTFGWWIGILAAMFALFCSAFVPDPFMGPFECVRSLGVLLHGSIRNLKLVFLTACLAHAAEASYAWKLAKSVDPENAKGWFWQTLALGFPSLRLLLARSKRKNA
ncbi:hypothetical protein SELMODRAFT_268862 [Selaginella moellendorffii]|uniref:3-beta hydroxysteroid dehydrogenase/isomerase domain-containing protein n=1 Tax=Selaginella moellendorffii TaxID=88036 RepID=D8SM26_SELML|nr:short-chain dehydrogenase/reductase family 42E member 1 [Selaginella moellendorffii]EFJ14416.1 hypothetical protein SELMODRAFT_268862 [Selaginella moellendorffii]|eukprot:XP_002984366.1 short-chain dehydrogenase/reductase family 42E member 1 [Selaginella moellendorffii]